MSETSKSYKWIRVDRAFAEPSVQVRATIPIGDDVSGPLQVQLANEAHIGLVGCWYGWVR